MGKFECVGEFFKFFNEISVNTEKTHQHIQTHTHTHTENKKNTNKTLSSDVEEFHSPHALSL